MRDRLHTARMLAFSLVFTPYLWNAVVSGKSPFLFSCFRSPQAAGIAHRPPRSLYWENKRRQTDRPSNPRCACAPRVNYLKVLLYLWYRKTVYNYSQSKSIIMSTII